MHVTCNANHTGDDQTGQTPTGKARAVSDAVGERGGRFNGGCIGGCMALTLMIIMRGKTARSIARSAGARYRTLGQYETPRVRRVGFLIAALLGTHTRVRRPGHLIGSIASAP